jgi:hypothetical protein
MWTPCPLGVPNKQISIIASGIITVCCCSTGDAMSPALREILERFDALPDCAALPTAVTATILGVSERTVRYHPQLKRVAVSKGRYGQSVGSVRRLLRGEMVPA